MKNVTWHIKCDNDGVVSYHVGAGLEWTGKIADSFPHDSKAEAEKAATALDLKEPLVVSVVPLLEGVMVEFEMANKGGPIYDAQEYLPSFFGHVMVDLETLGNKPNSAILTIGAVEFSLDSGETGRTFQIGIDLQSCLDAGLKINADTIMWWFGQSKEAQQRILDMPKVHLNIALIEFKKFLDECGGKDVCVWGNSARFDMGILSDAYSAGFWPSIPWDFRKERCVRTLLADAPDVAKAVTFEGVRHDAVHDCLHQIRQCFVVKKARYASVLGK